jgi:DNA-binding FrmR family transcriptional regulator
MHTTRDKKKLISRIRRIRGQIEAVEAGLAEDRACYAILQTLAAARGALNGLVAEIIEDHVRHHVLEPGARPTRKQAEAAEELIEVVRAYVK